jgi:hypothetical protein
MDRQSELAAIEQFIATEEPTRCPTVYAAPSQAAVSLAEEERLVQAMTLPDRPRTRFEKQLAKKRSRDGDQHGKRQAPKQVVITPRGKAITYQGVAYGSRMELARYLAPLLRRSEGGIQQLLIKFRDDPVAAVSYASHARKRIGKRGQTADNFPV